MAWRYEFYFLVLKTIFYSLAALLRKILSLTLENKIHIFAPPCNILYLLSPNKEDLIKFLPLLKICRRCKHSPVSYTSVCYPHLLPIHNILGKQNRLTLSRVFQRITLAKRIDMFTVNSCFADTSLLRTPR